MWTASDPTDEECRWLISIDDGDPFRCFLVSAGVEYPRMVGGLFRQGCSVLLGAELDETLPGKLGMYRVLDWFTSPSTARIGSETATWARRLRRGASPWEQVSICAPYEPRNERRELIAANPLFLCRNWRHEWSEHDFCLEVVKDRYNLPPYDEGMLRYESELPSARAALGRAMCDLDEAFAHYTRMSRPKPPPVPEQDAGIAGY